MAPTGNRTNLSGETGVKLMEPRQPIGGGIGMTSKTPVALVISALGLLAGCSTGSSSGTITGFASPCTGPVSSSGYANLPVDVTLSHGSHLVASTTVKGKHVYHFTVSPGQYVVSTHEGQGSRPVHITLRSGEVARVNIPSTCR